MTYRKLAKPEKLARCDQEIGEIMHRPDVQAGEAPAWLVALGVNDWEVEKLLIGRPRVTPYYEESGITIYHGDCREVLPQLGTFDLLLTDPPYGIGVSRRTFGAGRVKGGGFLDARGSNYQPKDYPESDWDDQPASAELLELCMARCRNHCIWGGNYFDLPPSMRWLVWDKKNDGTDFADAELAWTNQEKAVRIFRYRWNGMLQEHAGRHKEERTQPTMKPLALMQWCLTLFPDATSLVDTFMGSGSSIEAAKLAGIRAVGVEREERYCEIAAKRLSQEVFNFQ